LRCLYCFARGGERINDLSLNAAKAAIDLVLDRGITLNSQISRLVWHGGGEPTLAWELLKEVSLYHRQKAITLGIKPRLSIVSNGIWTQEKRQWIINNFDRITVSCDGPSEIQNKQRPFFNGSFSSDQVYENLRFLAEQKANFGIRATITEYNVRQMPAMVQFFYDLCKPKVIQFERLTVAGRCEQSKIEPGSTKDFIDYFKEAFKIAKSLNIGLVSSGTRIFRRTKYYCGVAGYSFCVTPEGFLTTCHRVDNLLHPLADKLIFGKWDENKKQYEWKENQLFKLRKELSVDNFKECQQCFCKYTCGGGCFARRAIDTNLQENCQIIQELTQFRLLTIAEEKGICKQVI